MSMNNDRVILCVPIVNLFSPFYFFLTRMSLKKKTFFFLDKPLANLDFGPLNVPL